MIFPDWGNAPGATSSDFELPLYQEWAVDWEHGCFALRDGRPYLLSGNPALQIWVRCALHPQSVRFAHSAHSSNYGNRLTAILGSYTDRGILESQLRREIRETLLVSPYIKDVDGFSFAFKGSRLTVTFTVHTIYDDMEGKQEVSLS